MKCEINSLYICVEDMDRAIRFYEDLFEQPVSERDRIYSVFDVNGFRFGLFAYREKNEPHTCGSSCLPSVSFDSREVLEKKLSGKEICFPLTAIKDNWVAEIVDSEGNHIELTARIRT
ncbi:MAG: VOC family protein [Ruminiclostridium sp.]|nr:VOC family protein [Ruminiclostridium sp.]